MDHYTVKCFFKGLCFIACIGGAASSPPTISGISSSTVLSFDETNTINFTLFTFTVTDENTVTIEPYDGVTRSLAVAIPNEISPQSGQKHQVNVTVMTIKPLDRDQGTGGQSLFQLRFNIRDSEENTVTTPNVYIQVNDVNDNAPEFKNLPYRWDIDEKPFNASAIYMNIRADDTDSGENSRLSYSMKSQDANTEYNSHFNITTDTGVVHLLNELDYEQNSYYQFTVTVQDHGNPPKSATADLIIRVKDVQDTPPFFTANLYRTAFDENMHMNTPVVQVNARDGDVGAPNDVTYQILPDDGCSKLFNIYSNGTVCTNDSIDRDEGVLLRKYGECILTVQVHEVNQAMFPQYGNTSAETNVTIIINDLDDNFPTFNQSIYTGSIFENSGEGVAIQIHGGIYVSDKDQGDNANLNISVTFADGSPCPTFAPDPSFVSQYGEIRIKVTNNKNYTLLDYEQTKSFELLVTVSESLNAKNSATATVNVTVLDVNDNVPQFLNGSYELSIHENPANGTSVGRVTATDKDKMYGNEILSYSLLGGQWFTINNATGEISTYCAPNVLDRERQDTFFMTLTVTDAAGHRNTSSLNITLTDENDNDPKFRQNVYEVQVDEIMNYTHPIITVKATDADMVDSENSLLYYNITQTSDAHFMNNVTINESTGEVSLRQSIDYEAINQTLKGIINITIMAFDNGQPQRNDTSVVRLTIQDINDCAPVFNKPGYSGETFENETSTLGAEFVVATVNATDNDGTDRNKGINYFIVSGSAGKFRVDPISGEVAIQVDAELDYERVKNYTLTVMALDQGSPPLNSTTIVRIQIKDVNDVSPIYTPHSCNIAVLENTTQGPLNLACKATDNDTHMYLNYKILSVLGAFDEVGHLVDVNLTTDWFKVNLTNGDISVTALADREIAKTVKLQTQVEDLYAEHPKPQYDTAEISITLNDTNDNDPQFTSEVYTGSVTEIAPNNTNILTLSATDKDENRTITYSLQTPHAAFQIHNVTGILSKVGYLDRETNANITLTAVATDNGEPTRSSIVQIKINVIDFNDNTPTFLNFEREITIPENASSETFVVVANATDADAGENARVIYRIIAGNSENKFNITPDTGEISVASLLDREKTANYDLTIEASDNPEDHSLQKSNTTHIVIKISDINDNPPTFSSGYKDRVLETAKNGTLILRVMAKDADDGENSRVTYTMVDDENMFFISTDGDISVSADLKDKVGMYNLTVIGTDHGNPQLMGNETVHISVEDVNLYAPLIGHIPRDSLIRVYECETIDKLIWTFNYTDRDYGQNANSTFDISEYEEATTLNNNTFEMRADGQLILKKSLDVNKQAEYKFYLRATDQGIPTPLSSQTLIKVNVIDVNNHLPTFLYSESNMTLLENSTSNVTVGTVHATDEDKDGKPCYSFKDEPLRENWTYYFALNNTTGDITNIQPVDYEQIHVIKLLIHVDDCSIQTNASCANNTKLSLTEGKLDLTVSVMIEDKNDSPPVFNERKLAIGMLYGTKIDTEFDLKLKNGTYVHDNDSKKYGSDSWKFYNDGPVIVNVKGDLKPDSGSKTCEDNKTHLFCVTHDGTIKVNKNIDETLSGYFIVPVLVNDTAGEDRANITIYLISISQIVTFNIRHNTVEADKMKDDILRKYSELFGYDFVFDKLSAHLIDGKAVSTSSDLEFHVVNRDTKEILQKNDVYTLMEKKSEDDTLVGLMNQYNIGTSFQATSNSKTGTEEESKRTFYILVGVTAGEALVILLFIYVWMNTKNRYKRKLKAANINVKDFEMNEMDEIVPSIPGSNMFSKSKNPLIDADVKDLNKGMAFNNDSYQKYDDLNLDENAVDARAEHMHTVYDSIEEKEVTMDMYTDDMPPGAYGRNASMSSEDLLGATLQLHALHKSRESLDNLDASLDEATEEEDGYEFQGRTRINPAFDDDLECTEI
ncbi:cadherin-23-like isoform X2 [Dreissena polymorpha]|uniref:cadherin-23-like isoform X2 n=1 Tax=Dreissena polymorpha TaxID=45954 RepID=UPI0022645314|nr:cadherin-23-like isoform X2 [Dreissena polymorpha]